MTKLTVAFCDFSNAPKTWDEALFALSGKVNSKMADIGVTKICVLVMEFLYTSLQVL
jgi:hypothetical protein